jgi:hypothetical protein
MLVFGLASRIRRPQDQQRADRERSSKATCSHRQRSVSGVSDLQSLDEQEGEVTSIPAK